MHWILIVVFMKLKKIRAYDSLHCPRMSYLRATRLYLRDEAHYLGRKNVDPMNFDLIDVDCASDPKQNNGNDCGVCALTTASLVVYQRPVAFQPAEIQNARDQLQLAFLDFVLHLQQKG